MQNQKSQEYNLQTNELKQGSWNYATITIPENDLSNLATIKLKMNLNTVSFNTNTEQLEDNFLLPSVQITDSVNSYIYGEFNGFEDSNLYELDNGQIWKQTSYYIIIILINIIHKY